MPTNGFVRFRGSVSCVFTFVLFACELTAAPPVGDSGSRPNILLIMADDLGFSDLGCYGGEIQTPHLDSLAESGLRFTQFYNTGRCWPTRGSLLTGYYAQQIRRDMLPGIPTGGGNRGRRPDWAPLLPKMLRQVGYRSYHTGKWHIDGEPQQSSFDRTSLAKSAGNYFKRLPRQKDQPLTFEDDYYVSTKMADDAIENLKQHSADHAAAPFFQYLAFTAPHFPLHALPEDIALYDGKYDVGWDVIRNRRWKRMQEMQLLNQVSVKRPSNVERQLGPPYHFPEAFEILGNGELNRPLPWSKLTDQQQEFQAKKMAIHAAMIHRMDIEIGRVFEQIRAMGQWENTMVMFLSDNGASAEIMVRGDGHDQDADPGSALSYLCLGPGWSTTCNTPFRRHKTWTHEGGTSTPFLVSWPDRIADGGTYRRNPHHVIDVVATVLDLTGADVPSDAPAPPGRSFLSEISPSNETVPDFTVSDETRTLWWFHDGHKAIRRGRWKGVAPIGEPWELYDLSNDRGESVDLAIPRGDILDQLVDAWEQQLSDTIDLASRDLSKEVLEKAKTQQGRSSKMREAQLAATPKRRQVLINAETLMVDGRHAFIMAPDNDKKSKNKPTQKPTHSLPWVFYGPTLPGTPDRHEEWMHQQLLDQGIAIAGIDVGEGYGSPHSQRYFDSLYDEMVSRGYSEKPALLGRSRGGLYVSRFAIERPDRVAGIAGIYPVFDYTSYPGTQRAASVYGVTPEEMVSRESELNPIKLASKIAKAKIPVFIIHGTDDKVVPIEKNSNALRRIYIENGNAALIEVEQVAGQGHNYWPGFFRSQKLVDFLVRVTNAEH